MTSGPDPVKAPAGTGSVSDRRTLLDRHRSAIAIVAVSVSLSSAVWLTWFYWPGPDNSLPSFAWYTVDDGRTRFADDVERNPPFEHDGKQAVRLHLFSCDGGKTTFVGYLQKFPEETLRKYRDKGVDPANVEDEELVAEGGWVYKRPGDAAWLSDRAADRKFLDVITVRCPDGRAGEPKELFPKSLGE